MAEICEYAPSQLMGKAGSGAVAGGAAATAAAGTGMKAAGLYTFTHAVTGATMIGSTAAGSSAAGTVGFIAGTAGALGSAAAFLLSPVVIAGAAATAVAVGVYEGACYLASGEEKVE